MRVIIPTLVGLAALATASVQAAAVPTNSHPHAKWHETPAQNVRKSQQYDYLVEDQWQFPCLPDEKGVRADQRS